MTRTFRARRFVALAGALSLGAGLLAACSSGSAGDDTSSPADTSTSASDTPAVEPADTLTLTSGYAAGDATGNFLDDAVAAFTAKTGIKVDVLPVAWDDLTDTVESNAAAGELTDLYTLNFADQAKQLVEDGALVDVSQYIKDWGIDQYLQDDATASWTENGKIGGFPYGAFYWPIWWNMDVLSKAGITAVPTTTDELIADAAKIRAAGLQPIGIDGADWGGSGFFWMMLQAYVPADEIQDLMANGGFADSADAVKGFDMIGKLRDAGVFVDNAEGFKNSEVQTEFFAGNLAAAHLGSWAYTQATDAGMDVSKIQLGGFPVPSDGVYDKPLALRGGGNGWMMSSAAAEDPARTAAVEEFIKFLYQPEQLQSWVGTYNQFSAATADAIGDVTPDNPLNLYSATELADTVDFAQLHDLYVKPGVDPTPEISWFLGTKGATGAELAARYDALYQD